MATTHELDISRDFIGDSIKALNEASRPLDPKEQDRLLDIVSKFAFMPFLYPGGIRYILSEPERQRILDQEDVLSYTFSDPTGEDAKMILRRMRAGEELGAVMLLEGVPVGFRQPVTEAVALHICDLFEEDPEILRPE